MNLHRRAYSPQLPGAWPSSTPERFSLDSVTDLPASRQVAFKSGTVFHNTSKATLNAGQPLTKLSPRPIASKPQFLSRETHPSHKFVDVYHDGNASTSPTSTSSTDVAPSSAQTNDSPFGSPQTFMSSPARPYRRYSYQPTMQRHGDHYTNADSEYKKSTAYQRPWSIALSSPSPTTSLTSSSPYSHHGIGMTPDDFLRFSSSSSSNPYTFPEEPDDSAAEYAAAFMSTAWGSGSNGSLNVLSDAEGAAAESSTHDEASSYNITELDYTLVNSSPQPNNRGQEDPKNKNKVVAKLRKIGGKMKKIFTGKKKLDKSTIAQRNKAASHKESVAQSASSFVLPKLTPSVPVDASPVAPPASNMMLAVQDRPIHGRTQSMNSFLTPGGGHGLSNRALSSLPAPTRSTIRPVSMTTVSGRLSVFIEREEENVPTAIEPDIDQPGDLRQQEEAKLTRNSRRFSMPSFSASKAQNWKF